ncbi:group 1 glycosyl transferase [Colwellia sp. 75C3]|uniref:TIGR03087 family PEP-CTERM/XrtA system glycosyltransferase n=1 Tax=Colwellia sp. 75C3 TaxID=888425 RepID=UPI000C338703|nr:TIGR03087 family PEP-CTERM/XrtA system glycosyltransferase [Colwellia sp. 75C3]PKG81321.1 group 1 glycosyl transferase [Colwellia sp. 75C3]
MNILFLAQRVPFPPNKGEKIRTFNQLKHLAEQKHKISVCAPLDQSEDVNYFKELADRYCENITNHALTVKPIRLLKGLLKGQALSVANFYVNELQNKFDCLLQQECFDVVICTSSAMAEYIYKSKSIQNLEKKPLLLMDFMDLDSDKWRQYAQTSNWPMKWIYQREARVLAKYEQQITHDFDTSFFIADAEVDLFNSRCSNAGKVLTMGNGMDTTAFVPAKAAPENEAPVFLFTGVMDYKPNVDAVVWFIETVWPSILAKYKKARFIIAGMNPSSAVNELTNITGIEVTGFVDDILPYYHQSDYFVAPFRLARGVQNKVLQAFACGLPVISTSMGAEGIDCVQDEHILIANNEVGFLSAVEKLENDQVFRTTIKKNALSLIHEHYSWQGKLQVLDDVLNGRL